MKIFLTGAAGFIGSHVAAALLDKGHAVAGVDSLNAYYDPALKHARLARLSGRNGFRFVHADIADAAALAAAAAGESYDVIVHLAAQAGVRYALTDPYAYTQSNLVGHHNVLELARHMKGLAHTIYASSSSVYGNDSTPPFSEDARADRPVSYYGATKRAGELMSHSYAELFGLKLTGLRFFTVYGRWGRPDMAYWLFTDAILKGKPLKVFGGGLLRRDFTWIDDIVAAVVRMVETPFAMEGKRRAAPSHLQSRQQPPRGCADADPHRRTGGRQIRHCRARSGSRRRCQRNLCRRHARRARFRFCALDDSGRRHPAFRRMVPQL